MFTWLRVWWFSSKVRSDDPRTRLAGLQGLARVRSEKYAERIRGQFHAALADDDKSVVLCAMHHLAKSSDKGAVDRLVRLVTHRDEAVYRAAREALDGLATAWKTSPAVRDLTRATLAEGDEPIQLRAIALVREGRDAGAIEDLIRMALLASDSLSQAAAAALDDLVPDWQSSPTAQDLLDKLLCGADRRDPRVAVRLVAFVKSLGTSGLPFAIKALRAGLEGRSADLWFAARSVLIRTAATASSELARLLTSDPSPAIREVAAVALGHAWSSKEVGSEGGMREAFVNALHDTDRHVRIAAAHALGEAQCTAAIGPLLDALGAHDRDKDFQEIAVRALGQLRAGAAREHLARLLKNASWEPTQVAAAWALTQVAGEEALPHIRKAAASVTRLQAYCYELLRQFHQLDESKALTGEMLNFRRAYNQWRRRIDTLNQGKLAMEIGQVMRQGNSINTVALLTQVHIDLRDCGVNLDDFLHSALKTISSGDAQVIAESWGLGGFWRTR